MGEYYEGERTFSGAVSAFETKFVQFADDGVDPGSATLALKFNGITMASMKLSDVLTNKCQQISLAMKISPGTYTVRVEFTTPIPGGGGALTLGTW